MSSKIQLHRFKTFAVVQTDLKSTVTCADSSEVIFLNSCIDNVFTARNLFESVSFSLWRQVSNYKINNFWSGILGARVMFKAWIACDKIVAGEKSLLNSLGLVTVNLNYFDSLWCGRSICFELNLIYVSFEVISLKNLVRATFWIIIQTNALLLLDTISESLVDLAPFRDWNWAYSRVVILNSRECFGKRCITLVVSLIENLRSQMFLFFFVRILSSNSIVWPRHASFSFPVGISSKGDFG